ncbi:MAG: EscU/YscU/HrcU family type III secretion system export apparatus switch protein [Exiguobacterium marinum]|uniref:EscU/YscU/HrcU family type III secretion system export apparatus switch protein n=1 Tax=Exiguobacterium marinum TaxID=273528 RepID=A0ABY7X1I8_9BACL|nr:MULTISPECIES: EscU/YscU/HrcU family type III secretion system export apparatus switch protein [Exiguobacterium]WDH76988.1 EscU/YscU/HrcU family type III secretion system export apparatus switch protein [Exiguobacterium marinum]
MKDQKKAMALSYEQSMDAPHVVAKGTGIVAERMLEIALENGIPVHEDPALLSLLSALNIEDQIPEDVYQVIAELFVFLYQMEQDKI